MPGTSVIDGSKPLNASLPRQQTSLANKLKGMDKFGISEFMKDTMDACEAIGRYSFFQNLALKINYGVVSKEFRLADYYDTTDYYDITSAIAQEFNVPYHLKHYDMIGKYVNLLIGEYLKRPDVFTVRASDADSINERVQIKTDLVQNYLQQSINQRVTTKMVQMGLDPNRTEFNSEEEAQQYKAEIEAKYKELTPESIEKYMKYDYRGAAEHWATGVLSNDRQRFNFRELEKIEFSDMLIADRCFSHVYLTPTGYNLETWNPINTFFHQAPEVRYAEDGDFAGRIFYMTKAQIIDRFGWRMQEEQIRQLYPKDYTGKQGGSVYGEFFNATMMPFPAYRDYSNVTTSLGIDPFSNAPVGDIPTLQFDDLNMGFPNYQFATGDICQVTEAYWRSQRKIGKISFLDPETGELQTEIVDESFDPELFGFTELKNTSWQEVEKEQEPNTVIWTWVTHIWQGCKVNANFAQSVEDRDRNAIYFDVKPCPFQFKGDFTVFQPKLPVIGGVFSNRNAKSNSFVDLLKPYQIAYNAFMNLAYGIAQRNNGKFFVMDMKLLSNMKDWGGEEAMQKAKTIMNELSLLPLDTSLQNTGGQTQFNQIAVHDLDESDKVERLIQLAIVWEEQGAKQVGITPQRQGQTQASETATGVQQAINNSYAVTEPYFENFYNYKRRKLKALIDVAQYCASKDRDITLQYTTSDLGEAFIKVNGTELMLRDIGVNITNSQETIQELELARRLAVENNTTKLPMSSLISMISLKSVTDIQKSLEAAEDKLRQEAQQQQAHEKELMDMQNKAVAEEKQKDRDLAKYKIDTDANVKLEVETLKGISNESSFDPNADLTDKLIAQKDLALRDREVNANIGIKQQESTNKLIESFNKKKTEEASQKFEEKIKKQEAQFKKDVEDKKNEGIDKQSKNQEKLLKDKATADMALLKEKHKAEMQKLDKELEMKQLDKKQKEAEMKIAKEKADAEIAMLEKKIALEERMGKVKANVIEKVGDAKVEEAEKLAKIKSKEAEQQNSLKMKENIQTHEHKIEQNEEKHKNSLVEGKEKHKQTLKNIKIKPKKK